MKKQMKDLLGLSLVGDGVLTLIDPKRHCLLWETGPQPCRDFIDEFVKHPTLARFIGAAEIGVGLWLASRQKPSAL